MSKAQNDIGRVKAIQAEAIGVPGKRTFRLLVDAAKGGACLWVEKEQLYQMAVSIQRMLAAMPKDRAAVPPPTERASDDEYEAFEFKIGRMGMGYDEEGDQFIFLVHDVDVLTATLEEAAEAAEEGGGELELEEGEEGEEGEEERLEEILSEIEPTLSFQVSRQVLADMCRQAQEVCMGGRPVCPLCNQPIDPKGHICPRTNGHHSAEARRTG
ncbi:MAG: DUF3090 family protein [Nitrospinota bacterium]